MRRSLTTAERVRLRSEAGVRARVNTASSLSALTASN